MMAIENKVGWRSKAVPYIFLFCLLLQGLARGVKAGHWHMTSSIDPLLRSLKHSPLRLLFTNSL